MWRHAWALQNGELRNSKGKRQLTRTSLTVRLAQGQAWSPWDSESSSAKCNAVVRWLPEWCGAWPCAVPHLALRRRQHVSETEELERGCVCSTAQMSGEGLRSL